jgi:phosphoglycolate phosphatase-like HAD superfamily hydrolase
MLADGLEILRLDLQRGRFRAALFDFDGTLSLIREGWARVMADMMVEILRETPAAEVQTELTAAVEELVARLNGRPTIFQMMQLAEEERRRGGRPPDPEVYLHRFHDLLMKRVGARTAALDAGTAAAAEWVVPGSHAVLDALRRRGVRLYLASGTQLTHVRREADLLGLTPYFREHVYGPGYDAREFSKRDVIERVLRDGELRGEELVGFGDGVVEIQELRRVGAAAVAVASDEVARRGIDAEKRRRLIEAGADVVIGDFRRHEALLRWLFAEG